MVEVLENPFSSLDAVADRIQEKYGIISEHRTIQDALHVAVTQKCNSGAELVAALPPGIKEKIAMLAAKLSITELALCNELLAELSATQNQTQQNKPRIKWG